jgi:MerR, DNA binding
MELGTRTKASGFATVVTNRLAVVQRARQAGFGLDEIRTLGFQDDWRLGRCDGEAQAAREKPRRPNVYFT